MFLYPPVGEDVAESEVKGGDQSDGERLREDRRAAQQVQREGEEQSEQCSQQVRPVKAYAAHHPGAAVSKQLPESDGIVGGGAGSVTACVLCTTWLRLLIVQPTSMEYSNIHLFQDEAIVGKHE